LDTFRDDFGEGRRRVRLGSIVKYQVVVGAQCGQPLPLVPALKRDGALDLWWSMIFSENRYPPRIKSGAGFFRIML
jgi:hypothetical protein